MTVSVTSPAPARVPPPETLNRRFIPRATSIGRGPFSCLLPRALQRSSVRRHRCVPVAVNAAALQYKQRRRIETPTPVAARSPRSQYAVSLNAGSTPLLAPDTVRIGLRNASPTRKRPLEARKAWSPPTPKKRTGSNHTPHNKKEGVSPATTNPTGQATTKETPSHTLLAGSDLLSHTLPGAVPSAQVGLASGFGMGPGVTPPL